MLFHIILALKRLHVISAIKYNRPSKKKTRFSSPSASFFSAASLFYYFLMSKVFMSKNQEASLLKPIAAVYTPK